MNGSGDDVSLQDTQSLPDDDMPTTQVPAVTDEVPAADSSVPVAAAVPVNTPSPRVRTRKRQPTPPSAAAAAAVSESLPDGRPIFVDQVPASAPAADQAAETDGPSATDVAGAEDVAEKVTPAVASTAGAASVDEVAPRLRQPKPKRRNPLIVALAVVLVLLLAGVGTLLAIGKYYDGKAKMGMQIAGVNVAGQSTTELQATAQQISGNTKLTTDLNGKKVDFSLSDLGVSLDSQKTAEQALATAGGSFGWWPFHSGNVPLSLSYSPDQVEQALDKAYSENAPKDASVSLDAASGQYVATPDVSGVTIDPASVDAAIDAIAKGGTVSTVSLVTKDAPAAIQTAAADQTAASANALATQAYKFTAGSKSYTLTAGQVTPFITLTPDPTNGAINVGVDQSAVASALPAILTAQVTTPAVNEKDLYTPDGSTKIAVDTWGKNGTTIADADAADAAQALTAAMTAGQPLTFDVKTTPQKYGVDKVNVGGAYDQPNGSKWIDVNKSTFVVTLWDGTTKYTSFLCVTGAPPFTTPSGTFYIYLRYTSTDMKGYNADGTTYFDKGVPWVSYFNGGIALHGAPWRSTFGYVGSHGCVNLAPSNAKILFDWAPLGTKVVVHS